MSSFALPSCVLSSASTGVVVLMSVLVEVVAAAVAAVLVGAVVAMQVPHSPGHSDFACVPTKLSRKHESAEYRPHSAGSGLPLHHAVVVVAVVVVDVKHIPPHVCGQARGR